jgi:2-amino-4-hydroxy-6-hydroxymethyldihydropteridine diphosphokinase
VSTQRRTGAIAFGANLGDRARTLKGALARVEKIPGVVVLKRTAWEPSAPQGGPAGQPEFLNGVALVESALEPLELLDALHAIETHFGRDRSQEELCGPRTLDLDLLFLGDLVFDEERLQLPHPRMESRLFVLGPLHQLRPEHVLASGRTPAEAIALLKPAGAANESGA